MMLFIFWNSATISGSRESSVVSFSISLGMTEVGSSPPTVRYFFRNSVSLLSLFQVYLLNHRRPQGCHCST